MLKRPLMSVAAFALAISSTIAYADPQAPPAVVADLRRVCAAEYQAAYNKRRSVPEMSHLSDSAIHLNVEPPFHSIGRISRLADFEMVLADWGHDPFMRCIITRRMAVLRGEARLGEAPVVSRTVPPPPAPTSQSASAAPVAPRPKAAPPVSGSAAAASEFAFNFLKEAGCASLPLAACDVLDRDNAINVLRTYQTLLVNKHCGTGNIQAAKQLLEVEMALDNDRCSAVLKGVGAI